MVVLDIERQDLPRRVQQDGLSAADHDNLDSGDAIGAYVGEQGKREINRNKFTSNPPEIARDLLQKVDAAEEERK